MEWLSLRGGLKGWEFLSQDGSFLVGRRSFFSENMFLDGEVGLAFPSIGTGKFGVGRLNPNTGKSVTLGVRPYPSHLYIQFGADKGRCDGNVKPQTLRRLNRRGKDVSELLCGESTFSIELERLALLPNADRRPQHVLPTYVYLESLELVHGDVEPPVVFAVTSVSGGGLFWSSIP